MINGSEVIEPCPISVAADMIVMVPSGAMLTHGDSALPVRSDPRTAAWAAGPSSASANESPAAPIIICRRDSLALVASMRRWWVMAQPSRDARSMARTMRG